MVACDSGSFAGAAFEAGFTGSGTAVIGSLEGSAGGEAFAVATGFFFGAGAASAFFFCDDGSCEA